MLELIQHVRRARWAHVAIANLRILIGFAFVPSGLKKVLDQPFTDPANTGPFHEFLHAFYATGFFYQFVGIVQLTIAVLLMTQRFAALGALLALPVLTAITVFCWSTGVVPTAIVATLMLAGVSTLVTWDFGTWRPLLRAPAEPSGSRPIDRRLWLFCGAGILALYLLICTMSGGIYRPRGVELDNPAFYMFPLIALFPVVTLAIEQRRRSRER